MWGCESDPARAVLLFLFVAFMHIESIPDGVFDQLMQRSWRDTIWWVNVFVLQDQSAMAMLLKAHDVHGRIFHELAQQAGGCMRPSFKIKLSC